MASAKDFFIALPKLCEAKNAERWARVNSLQFDNEMMGGTLFDRNDDDLADAFNRLETAFGFMAFKHDADRARYCKIIAELFVLAHYAKEHGEGGHEKRIAELLDTAEFYEGMYPDIDAYMSPADAARDGGWA